MTDELTTTQDCAARWGVSDGYARQVLASLDHVDRDPDTGAKRYKRAAADAARSSQPGRGRRLDLRSPAVVSHEAFLRLAADESIPAQHRALWALMQSGMRVGDALSLDVRDVDLDEGQAHVELPVKGRKPQTVPLSDRAAELAREVMAERSEGPLLMDKQGRPVSRYSAIKFAKVAAGLPVHAFKTPPHTLES
ncbi:tyrosine-type recombinase/integrase, partial [Streptomyces sp. NPDC059003]|uniref:tyrosine-type recombinase/integrase n=1 Tax=Streptomyces sp. NPDC059003 TaxID=3346691 RepID=UPI0036BAA912